MMYSKNCKPSINSPINLLFSENCLLRPQLTVLHFLSVKRHRIQIRDHKWMSSVLGLIMKLISGSNNSGDVNNPPCVVGWRVHIINLFQMTLSKNLSWLLKTMMNRRAIVRRNPRLGERFTWSPERGFQRLGITHGYFLCNQPGNL